MNWWDRPDIVSRFEAKIFKSDTCWIWTAATDRDGYGRFKLDGKMREAHRLALELSLRLPLGESHALHSCGNSGCVNPAHLRPGSHRDNMDDRTEFGRQGRGSAHVFAKLSEANVIEIRKLLSGDSPPTQKSLAIRFGVSAQTICRIKSGKKWRVTA